MPLTVPQRFGARAAITNGILSINLADLAAVGLDIANPSADAIFGALVILSRNSQPTDAATNPTIGVVVLPGATEPFKAFVTRGTTRQIEYQYPVSLYSNDTTGVTLDPDNIVS